ncbi:hypothetical protein GTV15_00060 [Streptomyces sp. SID7803]|nr:hypothetical protein [Streptomyces sp. SID7803]
MMRLRYTYVLVLLGIRGRTPVAVNTLRALVHDLDRAVTSDHPPVVAGQGAARPAAGDADLKPRRPRWMSAIPRRPRRPCA